MQIYENVDETPKENIKRWFKEKYVFLSFNKVLLLFIKKSPQEFIT